MSTTTLTRAAELLDECAAELRDCHTFKGDWGDEHEARESHDEMLAVAADLRAMIAASPAPPEPPQWRLIETAPKDGRQIILTNGVTVAQGWWLHEDPYVRDQRDPAGVYLDQQEHDGFDGWMDCEGGMQPDPTHWMPLPPAPGSAPPEQAAQPLMLNGLTEAETAGTASVLGLSGAAQPADVARPVAWARVHPDGSFAGELLLDDSIEDVRKRSGAWVPLTRAQAAPADVARLVDLRDVEIAGMESAIGHLAQLVDELRPGHDRYQFLRERDLDTIHEGGIFAGRTPDNVVINGEDLDAAIDAALAAKGGDHD